MSCIYKNSHKHVADYPQSIDIISLKKGVGRLSLSPLYPIFICMVPDELVQIIIRVNISSMLHRNLRRQVFDFLRLPSFQPGPRVQSWQWLVVILFVLQLINQLVPRVYKLKTYTCSKEAPLKGTGEGYPLM